MLNDIIQSLIPATYPLLRDSLKLSSSTHLADHNAAHRDGPGDGSAGAVVGLTRGTTGREHGLRPVRPRRPHPRPGLAPQGGTPADVATAFGAPDALGGGTGPVVPVSGREVLTAGPDLGALRAAVGALNG